ncbi:hypothetical protein [Flexibacterium corallicola]|uniref:hypothetical protein n=1 Tax=Flexibacterium corallicola TaxID=3037259 RepID=UPI00286EBC49|nr:hypothetical protein [Pseudovibrio sp. M1P-2-3]
MLKAAYSLYDKSRRPLRDQSFFLLRDLNIAVARIPDVAENLLPTLLERLALLTEGYGKPLHLRHPSPLISLCQFEIASARDLVRSSSRCLTITFTRDPLAKITDCYAKRIAHTNTASSRLAHYGIVPGQTFKKFVNRIVSIPDYRADNFFRSQSDIVSYKGKLIPSFYFRTENQRDEWERLRKLLILHHGLEIGECPRLQNQLQTDHNFLNGPDHSTLTRKLQTRYHKDIKAFYGDMLLNT